MKIAVNKCYGGFSLSLAVANKLKEQSIILREPSSFERKQKSFYCENEDFGIKSDNYNAWRSDKRLIKVIEEIGLENSNGEYAKIRIIEIPDDTKWYIDEYDGIETIHEQHNNW